MCSGGAVSLGLLDRRRGRRDSVSRASPGGARSGDFEELIATFRNSAEKQNFCSYELAETEVGWKEHSVSDADGNQITLTIADSAVEGQPAFTMLGGRHDAL